MYASGNEKKAWVAILISHKIHFKTDCDKRQRTLLNDQRINTTRIHNNYKCICTQLRDLQDRGGVRCGDHLSPHKYIKNTSTCGTVPTEQLLNAGRGPQTSKKARKSPHNWVGQKKKEKKRDKGIRMGPDPLGGSCEGGKVFTH